MWYNTLVLKTLEGSIRRPKVTTGDLSDPTDVLTQYSKDVGPFVQLTHQQEILLGQRIEAGKTALAYLDSLRSQGGIITLPQQVDFATQIDDGITAQNTLVTHNFYLAYDIAARIYNRTPVMPLSDLVQEGNLGLMRAAFKFDWRRNIRFSTYAGIWIEKFVRRAIQTQSRAVRLPHNIEDEIAKINSAESDFWRKKGQRPTDKDISGRIGMDEQIVRRRRSEAQSAISLEEPIGKDNEMRFGETIIDSSRLEEGYRHLLSGDRESLMREVLTAREYRIIELYLGLRDGYSYNMTQIAQKFDLHRSRISHIYIDAIKKLRKVFTHYDLSDLTP